jgi:predicted signal transduction protein with EAL and GGDEF domain
LLAGPHTDRKALRRLQRSQLTVVAEGVETDGQRNLLADLGCDVVQGFLCSPALSPQAFGRWLLDHSANRASAMLRRIGRSLSTRQGEDARVSERPERRQVL